MADYLTNNRSIEERVARLEAKEEEQDRRLNNMEQLVAIIKDIAYGLKDVQGGVSRIEKKVNSMEVRINELENKPARLSLKVLSYILTAAGSVVVTEIVKRIFSLGGK